VGHDGVQVGEHLLAVVGGVAELGVLGRRSDEAQPEGDGGIRPQRSAGVVARRVGRLRLDAVGEH
jgi:hypothetical protein